MSTSKLYEALEFPAAHNGSTIANRITMAALTPATWPLSTSA